MKTEKIEALKHRFRNNERSQQRKEDILDSDEWVVVSLVVRIVYDEPEPGKDEVCEL